MVWELGDVQEVYFIAELGKKTTEYELKSWCRDWCMSYWCMSYYCDILKQLDAFLVDEHCLARHWLLDELPICITNSSAISTEYSVPMQPAQQDDPRSW